MVERTKKLTRMGRRRFFETLAALGLSTQAVQGMTKEKLERLTGDPTEEVPLVSALRPKNPGKYQRPPIPDKPAEREAEYYTVSRDRWIRMESAYDAAQRVQKKIDRELDVPERVRSGVTRSVRGRHKKYTVLVNIEKSSQPATLSGTDSSGLKTLWDYSSRERTIDKIKDIVPDEVYGEADNNGESAVAAADAVSESSSAAVETVPVEYRYVDPVDEEGPADEATCEHLDSADHYQEPYYREFQGKKYVSAGSAITIKDDDGWEGTCTLGPRVYSEELNEHMFLTAAHCAVNQESGEDSTDSLYRSVGQPGPDENMGYIQSAQFWRTDSDTSYPMDAALISTRTGYSASSRIAGDEPGESDLFATATLGRDRLRDFEAGDTFIQQGARSGRCTRPLYSVSPETGGQEIRLQRPFEDGGGDSGGLYLVDDGDEVLVAGIHQRGDDVTIEHGPFGGPTYEQDVAEGTYIGDIEDQFGVQVN